MDVPRESSSISQLLHDAREGDPSARERLFTRLQQELRREASRLMQRERPDHTLNSTALLNEAVLRLLSGDVVDSAPDHRYLFAAAIRAMRQILVDHARHRAALKHGGEFQRQPLDAMVLGFEQRYGFELEALHTALELLGGHSPRQRDVVECRFFGNLSVQETADLLQISPGTVARDWRLARARLYRELRETD